MRAMAVTAALAIGLIGAGCGGDDGPDEDATPEEVASAFLTAVQEEDAEGMCATLSEASATRAAEEEDEDSCEAGIEKAFASEDAAASLAALEGAEIGEATIEGDAATVTATSSEGQEGEFNLVDEDGWKVDLEG